MHTFRKQLATFDPEIYEAIAGEESRQHDGVEMIPSENYTYLWQVGSCRPFGLRAMPPSSAAPQTNRRSSVSVIRCPESASRKCS